MRFDCIWVYPQAVGYLNLFETCLEEDFCHPAFTTSSIPWPKVPIPGGVLGEAGCGTQGCSLVGKLVITEKLASMIQLT